MSLPFVYFCYGSSLNTDHGIVYATIPSSDEFTTYQSSPREIELQYPTDWIKIDGPVLERMKANNSIPVVAFCPDDLSVMLLLIKEKLEKNNTLDQEVKEGISSLEKNQPAFKLIESNTTTLAGLPAYSLLFSGTYDPASDLERNPELAESVGQIFEPLPVNATTLHYTTIRDGYGYDLVYSDITGNTLKQQSTNPLLANLPSSPCSAFSAQSPAAGDLGGLLDPSVNSPPSQSPDISDPFSHYLPVAQKMIDSFTFNISNQTTAQEAISPSANQTTGQEAISPSANDDAILILKKRLANGEISVEEYNELLKIITSR